MKFELIRKVNLDKAVFCNETIIAPVRWTSRLNKLILSEVDFLGDPKDNEMVDPLNSRIPVSHTAAANNSLVERMLCKR